jgi:hypothetical protein
MAKGKRCVLCRHMHLNGPPHACCWRFANSRICNCFGGVVASLSEAKASEKGDNVTVEEYQT